ncbi:unnamed protein product [Gongylonema pulchrum]|uniref:PaREP10 n=1 Tax=Gongylonema pulchrum TaxID=637853 RepID=A0A183DKG3_9BILA|nr:unnamed protein product [Gongylonema pulchrum]
MGVNTYWRPVEELRRLGAIRTFLLIVATGDLWSGYTKMEIMRTALDVSRFVLNKLNREYMETVRAFYRKAN